MREHGDAVGKMSGDWTDHAVPYAAVIGIYAAVAIAAVYLSRQSRHVGLTSAFAALGLTFLVAKAQYGGYNGDFFAGTVAGLCLGIAGVLGLAVRLRRR